MSAEDNIAQAMAAIPGLGDIDAGVVDDLLKLETQVTYRSYYFPGGMPKKYVSGVGEDTDDIHYDGHTEERDIFAAYNPRYLDDYISQARQYGFHKHFLAFVDDSVKHMSFTDAADILSTITKASNPDKYYGIIAGLAFMGKLDAFAEDQKGIYNTSKKLLENDLKLGDKIVQNAYKQISSVVGQNMNEFINNDVGWLTSNEEYSFAADIYEQWKQKQDEYNEYKEKLWDALSNIESLNLCTNNVTGIMIGEVTLQQTATCIQKIGNATTETVLDDTTQGSGAGSLSGTSSSGAAIGQGSTDGNGVAYKLNGNTVASVVNRVINGPIVNGSNIVYIIALDTGDKGYMTEAHEITDATQQTIYTLPWSTSTFKDANGVPYYLFDNSFSTIKPSKITSVDKAFTTGSFNYMVTLDNNVKAYAKVNGNAYVICDALGYSNGYESIDTSYITTYQQEQQATNDSKGKTTVIIAVIIVVIILIGLAVFGYFYYTKIHVKDGVNGDVSDSVDGDVKDDVNSNVKDDVNGDVNGNVSDSVNNDVKDDVNSNVKDNVGDVDSSVKDGIGDSVKDAAMSDVNGGVNGNVSDSVNGNVNAIDITVEEA